MIHPFANCKIQKFVIVKAVQLVLKGLNQNTKCQKSKQINDDIKNVKILDIIKRDILYNPYQNYIQNYLNKLKYIKKYNYFIFFYIKKY